MKVLGGDEIHNLQHLHIPYFIDEYAIFRKLLHHAVKYNNNNMAQFIT
jgi:hypothetical protein